MGVVLVTGGSSGIGLATVERLAADGHRVFAAARRPTRNGLPPGVTPLELDVADAEAATPAVDAVVKEAGRIDALINNAGMNIGGAFEDVPEDDARRLFEVNLFGPMRLCRAVIPYFRENGGGRIVNVTSMNDVLPAPYAGWYSASKAALASASRVLDAEVHRFGISVSVVAPGLFRSEMSQALTEGTVPAGSHHTTVLESLRRQAVARVAGAGDPAVVADAVSVCLSADSAPARLVVGEDALSFAALLRDTSDDDFTALLREFVSGLDR